MLTYFAVMIIAYIIVVLIAPVFYWESTGAANDLRFAARRAERTAELEALNRSFKPFDRSVNDAIRKLKGQPCQRPREQAEHAVALYDQIKATKRKETNAGKHAKGGKNMVRRPAAAHGIRGKNVHKHAGKNERTGRSGSLSKKAHRAK